jgi:hypothetical protein
MKKLFLFLGLTVLLAILLWTISLKPQSKHEVIPTSEIVVASGIVSGGASAVSGNYKPEQDYEIEATAKWLADHSAGLIISQEPHSVTHEPIGTVIFGNSKIDLGETPPQFRCQLQTKTNPIMLGEKHQRRSFEIFAATILTKPDGLAILYPLSVTYPRWPNPNTGLESSGGFVFLKSENPLQKIGVIIPRVIPEQGDNAGMLEWQIQIRMNDRLTEVDIVSKAKMQDLGPDYIVLLATHSNKLPSRSSVVWFNFEKDGTLSLLEK